MTHTASSLPLSNDVGGTSPLSSNLALADAFKRIENRAYFSSTTPIISDYDDFQYVDCPYDDYQDNVPDND